MNNSEVAQSKQVRSPHINALPKWCIYERWLRGRYPKLSAVSKPDQLKSVIKDLSHYLFVGDPEHSIAGLPYDFAEERYKAIMLTLEQIHHRFMPRQWEKVCDMVRKKCEWRPKYMRGKGDGYQPEINEALAEKLRQTRTLKFERFIKANINREKEATLRILDAINNLFARFGKMPSVNAIKKYCGAHFNTVKRVLSRYSCLIVLVANEAAEKKSEGLENGSSTKSENPEAGGSDAGCGLVQSDGSSNPVLVPCRGSNPSSSKAVPTCECISDCSTRCDDARHTRTISNERTSSSERDSRKIESETKGVKPSFQQDNRQSQRPSGSRYSDARFAYQRAIQATSYQTLRSKTGSAIQSLIDIGHYVLYFQQVLSLIAVWTTSLRKNRNVPFVPCVGHLWNGVKMRKRGALFPSFQALLSDILATQTNHQNSTERVIYESE